MSQRTVVEFNHDRVHDIAKDELRFTQLLLRALRQGDAEAWKSLRPFGLTRAVQCHHSDDRKVVVRGHEYPIG